MDVLKQTWSRRRRIGIAFVLMLACAALTPNPGTAQASFVVQGAVVTADAETLIANARVELEGFDVVTTGPDGAFRFDPVRAGRYTLRVDAFGHGSVTRTLEVERDVSLTIHLEVVPFQLDSLLVEAHAVDFKGAVRDASHDVPLPNADVLTHQGTSTWTDRRGRFTLPVTEHIPIRVEVRAFGYLPLDSILVPDPDERYVFSVTPDPLVQRMIAEQIERIEERSKGRRSFFMKTLDREELVRWDNATLGELLDVKYRARLDRIQCVLIDERVIPPMIDTDVLYSTLARGIERIEFLFGGAMLRVYTRRFVENLVATRRPLREPIFVPAAKPVFCA